MLLLAGVSLVLVILVQVSESINSEYYNGSEPSGEGSELLATCQSGPHESIESDETPRKKWVFNGLYPYVRKDEAVEDDYHGIKIKDPYRWLENPHGEETQLFQLTQQNLTDEWLGNHTHKKLMREQMMKLANYEKFSSPQRQENNYFYFHNSGLQNHSVMYIQKNLTDSPTVFFDPNKLSSDGTIALKLYAFSEDGNQFAYCISKSGSDWNSLHIKNVETGQDYPEVLGDVKFPSISWTHDHKGFFYNRYMTIKGRADGTETTNHMGQGLYYHTLNTPQSQDVFCLNFPDNPSVGIHADVTDDGRYLLVGTTNNTQGMDLHYFDLHNLPAGKVTGKIPLNKLVDGMDHQYDVITNNGTQLIISTNKNAPNSKVIVMDLLNPKEENWKTLIPENKDHALEGVACVANDKLICHYVENVKSALYIHDVHNGTRLSQFKIPIGQICSIAGHKKYNEIFFTFTSFLVPSFIYHANIPEDINTPEINPTEFRVTENPEFNADLYQTKQVFYPSKDGTRIPMYVINRVGIWRNKQNPVIIYGYGGYGVSLLPSFSIGRCMWLRHFNGIYAIPNIRGGGEFGERWHKAGSLLNKQNVFDDFQYAAEYLIRKQWTRPNKIAIMGGSNGGLLVGACLNQRPDLYGAALVLVGALDMLRFNHFTIAYYSESEFGSPKNKTHFYNLLSYSPLHNIRPPPNGTQYPSVLVCTGDHDDRVPPLHSYKFVATLQEKIGHLPQQKNPLLLRIEPKAGHGQGTPLHKQMDELTDMYVFISKALDARYFHEMD